MRIKTAILTDDSKFRKVFSNIWGHSGGWLTFSCPHGVVYYLKCLLRSENSRDDIDGLLSMKHVPNMVVIDYGSYNCKACVSIEKRRCPNYMGIMRKEFYSSHTLVQLQYFHWMQKLQSSHKYTSFTERLYCHCMQPGIGERMKECFKNWFHQHCKNFERISNTNINLSQWYCSSCDPIPFVHINSLPYLVLDKVFMEYVLLMRKCT